MELKGKLDLFEKKIDTTVNPCAEVSLPPEVSTGFGIPDIDEFRRRLIHNRERPITPEDREQIIRHVDEMINDEERRRRDRENDDEEFRRMLARW